LWIVGIILVFLQYFIFKTSIFVFVANYLFQMIPTSIVLTIRYGISTILMRDLLSQKSRLATSHSILTISFFHPWYHRQ